MSTLRPYQADLKAGVYDAWRAGARNVVMQLATGGGKSEIIGAIHAEHQGASAVIAHRKELVGQLSLMLARRGLVHDVIASTTSQRHVVNAHIAKFGRSFFRPNSLMRVASIDTLIRAKNLSPWFQQVTLWTVDEGHHVVRDNKWHTGISKFPAHARGLLPTASPIRADGKGLGRHASGVADAMVQGPPMRWLIEEGFLTDYDLITALSDIQLFEDVVGASGDFTPAQLKEAAARSHIVGDAVKAYAQFAPGDLTILFAPDVDTAVKIAAAFVAAGVSAEVLHGEIDETYRVHLLRKFENQQIEVLVAVDIVSEGFDLPAVQTGIMDRKTMSLQVFMQQCGRMLRPMYAPGYDLSTRAGRLAAIANGPKPRAKIIDQVGNFTIHGPPDKARLWSLDDRERRRKGDAIPQKTCGAGWSQEALERLHITGDYRGPGPCYLQFEAFYKACPHCSLPIPPAATGTGGRSTPETVDGELALVDPAVLAKLRGEADANLMPLEDYQIWLHAQRVPPKGQMAHAIRHAEKLTAQNELWSLMGRFGGDRHAVGVDDATIQREFYMRFGVDVLTARTLNGADTLKLIGKIKGYFDG